MNNDLITSDRRLYLLNLARQHEEVSRLFPDLSATRLLNRLHAQGVACSADDVSEALALSQATTPNSQGLGAGTAADSLGVPRAEFNTWVATGFPVGMPKLHTIVVGKTGRILFDAYDLLAVKRWLYANPTRSNWKFPPAPDEAETETERELP